MARHEWEEDRDRGRSEWRSREWDPNRSETRERPGRWNRPDRSGAATNQGQPWDESGGYGGGMSAWSGKERRWGARDQYGQGSDEWMRGDDRWGGRNRDRLRDEWRSDAWRGWDRGDEWRDWGRGETGPNENWGRHTMNWGEGAETNDLRGREGGWGGYGSYDRERASEGRRFPEPYQPGRHAGRGPKNYQRSDERVREDVVERLTDHPDLDATDIDVEVQHCEVTLRGEVDERYAKHLAEDLAGQVWGVHDVHNQLHIRKHNETGRMSGAATFHSGSTSNPTLTAPAGQQPHRESRESTDQGARKS